jgi:hypothetical protein
MPYLIVRVDMQTVVELPFVVTEPTYLHSLRQRLGSWKITDV